MPKDTASQFEIPAEMRDLAEQNIEQARLALDRFISAAHDAVSTFEGRAKAARTGAKDVSEKAMACAEENVNNAFAFAQKLVRVKDIRDLMLLQADFVSAQMQTLSEQAREIGEAATKHAIGTGEND